ncbi:MAG: Cys-Gln thioester bond-forming surface protein, partial [Clostridia bacterium]|nr:Cys-Gln thioester bond-forming surface protein [Clostridia bacterium]
MIKKIRKRAIATMLLVLTMLSNLLPIFPMVQSLAVNNNDIGTSLHIVNAGAIPYHLKSHGVSSGGYVITHAVGYYDNGTFYPAFCMHRDRIGVDDTHEYSVTLTELLSDQATYNRVWRVVTNGYPYKSVEEMGVRDWLYAYQATKMAVYCVTGQANVEDFYATDEIGQEIVNAINRLVDIGNNGSATYRTPVANADKSGNMYLDGNYYVQNYTVSSNIEITSYDVAMTGFPDGTIITDTNGTQRNTFNVGETFQVRLPKNSVETGDINGKVRLTVTSKSYAVFYATSYDESLQDYTVTGDPLALTSSTTNLDLKGNTAGIKIKKIDADTNKPIPNTTFRISKEDGTEIGTATTGEDGTVTFNNLYQANYVVKEIKNNDDYVLSQETINIPAYYNKITDKTITNKHKEGDLTIYKVDKDNHKITLGNVEFDLFSEEFNKVIGTYTTDVNGEIH